PSLSARLSFSAPFRALSLLPHPSPTAIYALSLHDALPILELMYATCSLSLVCAKKLDGIHTNGDVKKAMEEAAAAQQAYMDFCQDRKSTRLNSSHVSISYAVFCLKKKKRERRYGRRRVRAG